MSFGNDEPRESAISILHEAASFGVATADLAELLQGILSRGIRAVNGYRGFIALTDFDNGRLSTQCVDGPGWTTDKRRQRLEWHTGEGKGITTFVAATGRPYRTGNVTDDPYYLKSFDDVISEVVVPILDSQHRTRGVINVDAPRQDAFDDDDVSLLVALADIAALGIRIDDHRNREQAFVEISTELAASPDIPSLLSKVIRVAAEVLRFEDCSLFMLEKEGQTLTLEASRGPLSDQVGRAAYKVGEGLTGWIAEHGLPIRTSKPNKDPRWLGLYREFGPEEIGAFLGVPIESREGIIGVLRATRRRGKFPWFNNEFTQDDETVLMSIASQVGAMVQNLRLTDRVINAERMAAWGEMSARSAHMMGNRIFAIKGDLNELNYQLGQLPEHEREELQDLAGSINRGISRLEEILQEFRDFVMATHISLDDVDINALLKESIEEFVPRRSPVRLEISLTSDLPPVGADQVKLKRCFAELIENAISFQIEGGLLRISTELATAKEASTLCGLRGKQKYIRVEFADAGPGIPEDDKSKIFTPFFTSRAKGMGLGLSIVQGIIKAHHGGICEIGRQGSGAKFVIFLPIGGQKRR
ncbi:MAG TPA: GAF domain-containing protein [Armatimonadota bacterium]|jgi:signal transduction histidine kinase